MSIEEIQITIQHREASLATMQRTAHRFSGRYSVSVIDEPGQSRIRIGGAVESADDVERQFRALLLDDLLRARIENETAPLRRLIVEAALRSALREPEAGT